MSGKSAPELIVTSQEIAEAFKRSKLSIDKFAGFEEGYRLARVVRAEGFYQMSEQCPTTHIELTSTVGAAA